MVTPSAEYKTLQVKVQAAAPFTKHLFLKQHSSREDDLPAGRTLFVAGIPLTISADDLVELFSAFGDVGSLAVHPSRVGGMPAQMCLSRWRWHNGSMHCGCLARMHAYSTCSTR